MDKCELTILMPCLNEEKTIQKCIRNAQLFLKKYQIQGEILIVDNDSTDASGELARKADARVVTVKERGYGNALMQGSKEARGTFIIMGDADGSYDFTELMPILSKLREGCDLVVGNRFRGGIEQDAMPFWHRYLGNPLLSFFGRLLYPCEIKDFHCGLRGYRKIKIQQLNIKSEGMEYASEMIIKAVRAQYRVEEVPVRLKKDGREGPSHLRSVRDGLRHMEVLLRYRPILSAVLTFLITCMLCMGLLFGTSVIPQKAIQKKIEESADYFTEHSLFEERIEGYPFTKVDNYADCILTNIIYCMDYEHPVSGAIKASYYNLPTENVNISLQKMLNGTVEKTTMDYFRYWHGSMFFLRPIFTMFSIAEIRMILGIGILGLYVWLCLYLCKKKFYGPAGILAVGMLGVHGWMSLFCLEYMMVFLVTVWILFGIAVKEMQKNTVEEKRESFYIRLFVSSGVWTCFVDFLTAETLTLTVPLLLYYMMRFQKKELASWKKELCFAIKCAVSWGSAYVMMFIVKWGLACIQLGTNAFREAWADAAVRIGGAEIGEIISRNVSMLFPFGIDGKKAAMIFFSSILALTVFAIWKMRAKKKAGKNFMIPVLVIGCVPYIRYLFLRNHSYLHYFFTYRAQMAVLIAVAALLWAALQRNEQL